MPDSGTFAVPALHPIDLIAVAYLAVAAAIGLYRGAVREVAITLGLIFPVFISMAAQARFASDLTVHLGVQPLWAFLLTALLVFGGALAAFMWIGSYVDAYVSRLAGLATLNRFGGLALGVVRALVVVLMLAWLVRGIGHFAGPRAVRLMATVETTYTFQALDRAIPFVTENLPGAAPLHGIDALLRDPRGAQERLMASPELETLLRDPEVTAFFDNKNVRAILDDPKIRDKMLRRDMSAVFDLMADPRTRMVMEDPALQTVVPKILAQTIRILESSTGEVRAERSPSAERVPSAFPPPWSASGSPERRPREGRPRTFAFAPGTNGVAFAPGTGGIVFPEAVSTVSVSTASVLLPREGAR